MSNKTIVDYKIVKVWKNKAKSMRKYKYIGKPIFCHNTPPLNNPKNLKKRQRKRRMK